jgi:hypothetical protein
MHPIVNELQRVPKEDTVLPLSTPIVGISGKVYEELPVPAGTIMNLSLVGYNLYACLILVRTTGAETGFAFS